ncbi:E3 ubiquitin-protein ligase RNF26 [Thalassophryne amazonica]|uniref:E3 ubiquitin-protein ligase RNF26 n=1 Tax=Thalassophryne amazonica TaxID=390379 RepID=UPI0014726588|nr:E3 ubiquitin-protein ligase RNF26 [Thalassophryne amazonica]
MALVTVISTVGKCLDIICLLLDLNFVIVHSLIRTVLVVVAFIASLPSLFLNSAAQLSNFLVFCFMSVAEMISHVAHSGVTMVGPVLLALEEVLESLKMVGYLSMHVLIRGKEHLCRGMLSVLECCGIAVSLAIYFANTMVNYTLIATQNMYSGLIGLWQAVSSPLQKVLELALTSLTFLYSSVVGTSAFLWSPCKLLLDFLISLVHIFISVFILNFYGLLLTVTIALTTTVYLNPELARHSGARILDYANSFPTLNRFCLGLQRLIFAFQSAPLFARRAVLRLQVMCNHFYLLERGFWQQLSLFRDHLGVVHLIFAFQSAPLFARCVVLHLRRIFHHMHLLERGFWQQLSLLSSRLSVVLRMLHHRSANNRVGGNGDTGQERRGPPDGRAGDGTRRELQDLTASSSSADNPLKKPSVCDKGEKPLPAESLLSLLKEQEERKKCVICQDCVKTVVLLPCRHLCLCRACTDILLRQPIYQQNCPLCRHMILNNLDVYL